MKPGAENIIPLTQSCDLCGSTTSQFILASPRLDGPLYRCHHCGLYFVNKTSSQITATTESTATIGASGSVTRPSSASLPNAAEEMRRLAVRARELRLVEPDVEEREKHWRELTAKERLNELRQFIEQGKLLEIGCSTGEFLLSANEFFQVAGVEADEASAQVARFRNLECRNGTLQDAAFQNEQFDIAVMYHVIEHLPSPRATLEELHRILRPGGWLVIETPDISTFWVKVLGARWRQFIPDHIYFFTPDTIRRLCQQTGFQVCELRSAGKVMSVRLFLSRLGRYHQPLARTLSKLSERLGLDDRTLRLNPGDVMRLYAQKISDE